MQNHYNYVFDDFTNTYNFTTKNAILYRVAFIVDETFSAISGEDISNIFQLIIEKATDEAEPFDSKVSKTIENIIEKFFQKVENSLVYICSDEDERAKLRYDIFNRWYQNSAYRENVVKIDNVLNINITEFEIHQLYTSFLFHKNNSDYKKLTDIYSQIERILNDK